MLAKSVSLGFFLSILPLPGLNLPIGVVLAKLFRLNLVATSVPALPMTYVSPLVLVANYKVGTFFITSGTKYQKFIFDLTNWHKMMDFFVHTGLAYLLGSVINALLAAIMSYLVFLWIFRNASKILINNKAKPT
jgi:uncharacterized protein (DUF2062 family)